MSGNGTVGSPSAERVGVTLADQVSERPIRVLQPFRELLPTTNPYIVMLHRSLETTPGVEPVLFSYRRALVGRYDVVHMHWPETRLGGRTRTRRAVRLAFAYLYLSRLRLSRTPIVRTVHNLERPSGLSRLDQGFLALVERWTTLEIVLNSRTPARGKPSVTIVHGHYRDWFEAAPRSVAIPGRIAYTGLVRRYKNVDGLITAFQAARALNPALTLLIAGKPSDKVIEAEVREARGDDDSVTLDLRFLDDEDLVGAITSSELVALPYRHMHNSGSALLALSLDRPVLVPANDVNADLAQEVGPGWVHQFADSLDETAIAGALRDSRTCGPRPDLSGREWDDAGRAHAAAYAEAIRLRRRRTAP